MIASMDAATNVLVHNYRDTDRRLVHASIRSCLEQHPRYLAHVLAFLDRAPAEAGPTPPG